jgi:hypothetical protein
LAKRKRVEPTCDHCQEFMRVKKKPACRDTGTGIKSYRILKDTTVCSLARFWPTRESKAPLGWM